MSNFKHGGKNTRLYSIWKTMRNRCRNPNNYKYHRYGGRGISVCEEWDDFETFREWALLNGYSDDLTIDRIDNDGDYTPSNCRWATPVMQSNNRSLRSDSVLIEWNGITHTLTEWGVLLNINKTTLSARYNHGWELPRLFEETRKYVRRNCK